MARYDCFIIFISLLHLITATASVYYVMPEDQPHRINNDCPSNHECHTLQYYIFSTTTTVNISHQILNYISYREVFILILTL